LQRLQKKIQTLHRFDVSHSRRLPTQQKPEERKPTMNTSIEVITSHSTVLGAKAFLIMGDYAHNGNAVQSLPMSADDLVALAAELLEAAEQMNLDADVDAADRQADHASGKGTDQYALELAKQRDKDRAAGIYATNPMGKAAQELAAQMLKGTQ
jgi:hypothetical protein